LEVPRLNWVEFVWGGHIGEEASRGGIPDDSGSSANKVGNKREPKHHAYANNCRDRRKLERRCVAWGEQSSVKHGRHHLL